MRQLRDSRNPRSATAAAEPAPFAILAADEAGEGRLLRFAVAGAFAFHLLLMLLPLPEAAAVADAEPEKTRLFVVPTPRLKPPEIPPVEEIPPVRPFIVPVPDPTPDQPEPIRPLAAFDREIEPPEIAWEGEIVPPPPEEPTGPIPIGGAVVRPFPVDTPQPIYPEAARRVRVQGAVIVRAIVDTEGRVSIVRVVKELPVGLTEAAVTALERWRYRPATLNGKPVAVYLDVTVRFELQ